VELKLLNVPSEVILERPFGLQVEIFNRSDRLLNARLAFVRNKMTGVHVNGISGQVRSCLQYTLLLQVFLLMSFQQLGVIAPKASKVVPLSFFPLKPGVQKISGLQIVEIHSDKKYEFDNITSVLVLDRPDDGS
jgi:hypothetical protein